MAVVTPFYYAIVTKRGRQNIRYIHFVHIFLSLIYASIFNEINIYRIIKSEIVKE